MDIWRVPANILFAISKSDLLTSLILLVISSMAYTWMLWVKPSLSTRGSTYSLVSKLEVWPPATVRIIFLDLPLKPALSA